ncbi:MAG: NUDIX hydrolase [Micrococcales bacterium]|nr:NUDIX hydrolase [Micrococcales bacterium]
MSQSAEPNPAVTDAEAHYPVTASSTEFRGRIWDIKADQVTLPGGDQVRREYVAHPGAVAVIALDEQGRVLLQRQYRHPVRAQLFEPPAGLLDVAGEPPIDTAKRELAEEADLRAADWRPLITYNASPGGSDEAVQVFLARQLTPVPPAERFTRTDEEAALEPVWLDLDQAAALVLGGALHSPTAVVGVLAACQVRDAAGFDALEKVA